jgi:hypothetical protein
MYQNVFFRRQSHLISDMELEDILQQRTITASQLQDLSEFLQFTIPEKLCHYVGVVPPVQLTNDHQSVPYTYTG